MCVTVCAQCGGTRAPRPGCPQGRLGYFPGTLSPGFFLYGIKKEASFHTAPGTGAGKKPLKNDTRPGGRNGLPRERRSWPAVPSPS